MSVYGSDEIKSSVSGTSLSTYSEDKTTSLSFIFLTDREKSAIKKADFSPREKAFVYLIFYFGLRREEALAIMPNDFDFKKNTLKVNKAVIFDGNNGKIEMTKNKTSDRTLPIPAESIGFFKNYISKLNTVYLVTKLNGELMTQSSYTKTVL